MTEPIERAFAPDGRIARTLSGFEPRAGQVQMAQLVERALLEGMHAIVEAGTGVGKSLGYLLPAVRSGKKVVLSTGTIALQEQLVTKDVPLIARALGIPLRVTLLKGRGHYLCRQKFERLRSERLVASSASMQRMWEWGDRTGTGDRAELPFVPSSLEWEQLDADADDCTGEFCERFRDCHFFRKRDEAKYADIVVVNHALFFLDLAMGGGLLPAYDVAVLDEAHQCERWAIDALTSTVSRATIGRTMRKLHRAYHLPPDFERRVDESLRGLESALATVRGERYPLSANEGAWPTLEELRAVFYDLENWILAHWHDALKKRVDNEAEAQRRRDLAVRAVTAHASAIERAGAAESETHRVGRTHRKRRPLRAQLRTVRRIGVSTHDAVRAHAERRDDQRNNRGRCRQRKCRSVRLLQTIAGHRRCARTDRAVAVRFRPASAAVRRAGGHQSERQRF